MPVSVVRPRRAATNAQVGDHAVGPEREQRELAAVADVLVVPAGAHVGALVLGEATAWALGAAIGWGLGAAIAWCGLAGMNTGLVLVGGRMLKRFDVARDRG